MREQAISCFRADGIVFRLMVLDTLSAVPLRERSGWWRSDILSAPFRVCFQAD